MVLDRPHVEMRLDRYEQIWNTLRRDHGTNIAHASHVWRNLVSSVESCLNIEENNGSLEHCFYALRVYILHLVHDEKFRAREFTQIEGAYPDLSELDSPNYALSAHKRLIFKKLNQ